MYSKLFPYHPFLLIILSLILAACQAPPVSPEPIVETVVVTEVVEATPVEVIQVITPTPEPAGPRTLVICTGLNPDTLYPYSSPGTSILYESFAEGGWKAFDNNSFAYQPVILEKLPNLADGDAAIDVVTVGEGDLVVDASGGVVTLGPNADQSIMIKPVGGGEAIPYLASYIAIDDLTTMWTGLPGYLDTEYYINFFGPAPEHIWGQYSAAELLEAEESHRKPIGWGPYLIDEWVEGEMITLYKNPNYFRADEGLPKFDTLIIRFSDNAEANIAALLSGECDVLDRNALDADQSQLLLDLQAADQIRATFTTGTIWEHVDFGIQHVDYDDGYQLGVDRPDFFSDVRTRRAFAMCIDRQELVEALTFGQSTVIDTYLPPQHPLHNPNVRHYDFDVQEGSALLKEVGWVDQDGDPETPRVAQGVLNVPNGTRLELALESSTGRSQIVTFIQGSLAQCGIRANVQTHSAAEWFADGPQGALFGRQFDLGEFAWLTGVAPPCELYLSNRTTGPAGEEWVSIQDGAERTFGETGWSDNNNPGFADEEYDRVCNTALGSLPGQPEYEEAHLEAQRIFAEQLPVVPLYPLIRLSATRPDMCGFIVDPTNESEFWNIEEFDYGEGCQ
jgi:peptide/nickel transport system substrate-binding protein